MKGKQEERKKKEKCQNSKGGKAVRDFQKERKDDEKCENSDANILHTQTARTNPWQRKEKKKRRKNTPLICITAKAPGPICMKSKQPPNSIYHLNDDDTEKCGMHEVQVRLSSKSNHV